MKKMRFFNLIGMGGVADHEPKLAHHWERRFDIALFPVALFALLAWYDYKRGSTNSFFDPVVHIWSDWLIWIFFVTEMVALSLLCQSPWHYIRRNWFNLALIILIFPPAWGQQELAILRALRFLLVILKIANLSSTIRIILSRNNLGITILVAWIFVFCSGVMMAAIEPDFASVWDGVWWAWVTVTTVGYGDIVPTTGSGRILAGLVMLMGMGLFSLITANFSAFFVAREERKIVKKEQEVLETEEKVLVGEQRILQHLQQIESRLHAMERKIGALDAKQDGDE